MWRTCAGDRGIVSRALQTEIKRLDVKSLVQTTTQEGGKATFFGNAEVKVGTGEEATTQQITYRIDVDDVAEPGKGKDPLKVQTDSGYAAAGSWKEGIFRSTAISAYNERSEQGREGFLRGPPSSPV
jgi:hypothetical protein